MEKSEILENESDNEAKLVVYEASFILIPSIPEEKLSEEVSGIRAILEKNKAVFISEGFPKLIGLTYQMSKRIQAKIHKFKDGYFGWVKFEADKSDISKIKNALEENLNILRFLLVKTVKESPLPFVKVSSLKKSESLKVAKKEGASNKEKAGKNIMSEEEIDKSIDDLITAIE